MGLVQIILLWLFKMIMLLVMVFIKVCNCCFLVWSVVLVCLLWLMFWVKQRILLVCLLLLILKVEIFIIKQCIDCLLLVNLKLNFFFLWVWSVVNFFSLKYFGGSNRFCCGLVLIMGLGIGVLLELFFSKLLGILRQMILFLIRLQR